MVTFDGIHTVRAGLAWPVTEKKADYLAIVRGNQPGLHAQLRKLPWKTVPAAASYHGRGHGRQEQRMLQAVTVSAGLNFPHAAQALRITRRTRPLPSGKWRTVTVHAVTSLAFGQATPAELAGWIRGHREIEALHHIRDVTFAEDASQIRTRSGPQVMAILRKLAITLFRQAGHANIAAACRHHARSALRPLAILGLSSL